MLSSKREVPRAVRNSKVRRQDKFRRDWSRIKGHTLKKFINNPPYREWGPTVNQSGEVIKCDTQTYIVKYIYIKNIWRHPFKLAVLRAVCTRAQVQRMRESRLTITGDGDQDHVAYKVRHIVPTALLVRVQCLRNSLYKAVKGPSTIVLSSSRWSPGHTSDVAGVWLFKSPIRQNSLRIWPSLVCRLDHRRRPGERFLPKQILRINDISPNLDKRSEYDLKNFPIEFRSLWYL